MQKSKLVPDVKKIILVVFITVLIWVWADLMQDEELSNVPATVYVDEAANPELWVSLDGGVSSLIKITLTGPASRINDVKRRLELRDAAKRLKFSFKFDAAAEKFEPAEVASTLELLPFLQKDVDIRKLGLNVGAVTPERISVEVRRLIKRRLPVECVDEAGGLLRAEYIKPEQIEMLVPEAWEGEILKAYAEVSRSQVGSVAISPVRVRPYIWLAADWQKYADDEVEIKMHPVEPRLKEYQLSTVIGFTCSQNLLGKYGVELLNPDQVPSIVRFRATPQAESAYRNISFKLLLVIEDADANATEPLVRPLIYNFPAEFVLQNEISAIQPAPEVKFKLNPAAVVSESAGSP